MSTGPNLVDIVGEQVDLTDQSDKSMAPAIVNFSDQYLPGDMTKPDKEKLKDALKQVFKNKNQPPPPCNASNKDLILKSLEARLEKLREQRNTASKVKDTAGTRTTIEHIKRLCSFIDTFRKADCNDQGLVYNESGLGELTDSTINTLMKQFIFVMLQAHMPIEDYKQFTQEAKDIIRKVGRMPSDLDEIIRKFEGKIPERLKELIACMKLVPLDDIQKMIGNEIQILLGKILDRVKKVIPKDDPFWKVVKENDIESIVDGLLERIKENNNSDPELTRLKSLFERLRGNSEELLKQINTLEKEIRTLRDSLKEPSSSQDDILHKLKLKMKELEALLTLLNQQDGRYKANLLVNMTPEQIKHLQSQLASLEGNVESLSKTKEGLKTSLTEMVTSTDGSSNTTLMNINRLSRKALEELRSKNNTLEQQLEELQKLHKEEIAEGSQELATLKLKHEAEILILKKENTEYKAYINELRILNIQLENEINRLTSLVNLKEAELSALHSEVNTSQNEIKSLSEEIDLLKIRIEELVKQFNETKLVLDKAISEYELIGPLLDEIEKDIEILKAESKTKDKKITELRTDKLKIVSLEASLRNCQAKLKRLEEKSTLFDHLILETQKLETKLLANDLTNATIDAFIAALKAKEEKSTLFDHLILETQKLETKLLANDLTNATIDAFIAALKAKEDELRRCGEDGVKAKAAIDAITVTLTELTKEVEKKKGESVDLKARAEKAEKEAKEAKEAAEKAAKEAANTKNAATKAAAAAATEIAKAKQEAADAIQKANEDAKAAIGTAQEAQKAAEAEKIALQAQVNQANTIASVKQTEADAAALAVKQAEDQLKNAQNEVSKKQAEADLAIAQANQATTAAEARAAEAEAKAVAAEAAVLQAEQAAKALVLQASSSQAEQAAKAEAEKQEALARAEQAEAAKKLKEAEAAVAVAAQQAEQSLREAAEKQSGENKEALEKAAERIQEAENEKTGLEQQLETLKQELEASKNNSIDREALKTILAAIIETNNFTPLGEGYEDIDNQLEQLSNTIYLKEYIAYMVSNIDTPEKIVDPPPELAPLVLALQNVKQIKEENKLQESCYLYFFASHVQVTHFPTSDVDTRILDRSRKISEKYETILTDLLDMEKNKLFGGKVENIINTVLPILRLMEIIYMSKKKLAFKFTNTEIPKNFLTILKALLKTHNAPTFDINKNFSMGASGTDNNSLENIYILDGKDDKSFQILNTEPIRNVGTSGKVPPPVQAANFTDGSILIGNYAKLERDLVNIVNIAVPSPEKIENIDTTFTYPVLFYLLIFSLKKYLNPSKGILKGNKCLLPKILQLPPVPKEL